MKKNLARVSTIVHNVFLRLSLLDNTFFTFFIRTPIVKYSVM